MCRKISLAAIALVILFIGVPSKANVTNTVPYSEGFETYSRNFSLAGTNGWYGSAVAATIVKSYYLDDYVSLFPLLTNHSSVLEIQTVITNRIQAPITSDLWTDMLIMGNGTGVAIGDVSSDVHLAFYITASGRVNLWQRGVAGRRQPRWCTFTNAPVSTASWCRITVDADYSFADASGYRYFRLLLNDVELTSDFGAVNRDGTGGSGGAWNTMAPTNGPPPDWIVISNFLGSSINGYVDDLVVTTSAPDLSAPPQATVTIVATDPSARGAYYDTGKFTVTRTGGDTNLPVIVRYTAGGSAVGGVDYDALSGALFIPARGLSGDITIVPMSSAGGDEVKTVTLTLVSNAYCVAGSPSSDTVSIYSAETEANRRHREASSRSTGIIISEIMYHPYPREDGRNLEFIEFYNTEWVDIDISGYRLSGAADYTFPADTILGRRGSIVVAANPADMEAVYGIPNAHGPYTGNLDNASGTVRLRNARDAVLLEVEYSDSLPWPVSADGAGYSLVPVKPDYGENDYRAWGPSSLFGGTPGSPDPYNTVVPSVVINEFLAHTDDPQYDYIELYNAGAEPVDISGCVLTDDPTTNKFTVPPSTIIPAYGFLAFSTNAPYYLPFELSYAGESIFLIGSNRQSVIDAVRFEAQNNGVSSGRYPDGSPTFHELMVPTVAASNAPLLIRDIVINEIMFNPISGNNDDEFVELFNKGTGVVDMSYWRFVDGIDFMFSNGTAIGPGEYLVVAKNVTNMVAKYAALDYGNTVGDYGGSLANRGERLVLAMPGDPAYPYRDFVVVDEVTYSDGERWGRWTDGGGSSLELIDCRSDNRLGMNWSGSNERSKDTSLWTTISATGTLDNGRDDAPERLQELQVILLGSGECLVDNISITKSGGANLVPDNGSFESGMGSWIMQGTHEDSHLETSEGYGSAKSLHLVAEAGGDNGSNRAETDINGGLNINDMNVTISAKVRWLAGHRDVLFRLQGNHLEAVGTMDVPPDLGTPGARNSCFSTNAGPAISDVQHYPLLPGANSNVIVSARIHDPDGLDYVRVKYRPDPGSYSTLDMHDDGTGGDAVPGDGVFSASVPGQSVNTLMAFRVEARDLHTQAAATVFPENPTNECLVMFGQTMPSGDFGTYRFYITSATRSKWASAPKCGNELMPCTVIYGNYRAIYECGMRYRGSPFIRGVGDPISTDSAYVFKVPREERVLGGRSFNIDGMEFGRDDTYQRERTCFWIADKLGIQFVYQRYVHVYLNDSHRGVIYADGHYPSGDYLDTWFPGDTDGELFEIDDWFEFDDSFGFGIANATIQDFTTTGGAKKGARYRWNWEQKPSSASGDNLQSIFELADAMNLPLGRTYDARVSAIVDFENWMREFAVRHIVCDWDGYGYERGKNSYTYKTGNGKWQMLLWDLDFSLGASSDSINHVIFDKINDEVLRNSFYVHPRFRRAYYRAMQEAVEGPLREDDCAVTIDGFYEALTTNGVVVNTPITLKAWIEARRQSIISQIASVTNVLFDAPGGFSTGSSPTTLQGTAPVKVKTLLVNAEEYPVYWTDNTTWELKVSLTNSGNNLLVITALDRHGNVVGTDQLTVNYSGGQPSPADKLVINEIMYHPLKPYAAFVEIGNLSASETFDLSGYRLNGVDFTFGAGTFIAPTSFVVVAGSLAGYQSAYGNAEVVVGEFSGKLDNGGETVSLLMPQGTNSWIVLDKVTYDDDPPWPAAADGSGPSLQLIDATRDNNRVGNWAVDLSVLYTPGYANSVAASLPEFPDIWINEIMPINTVTLMDNMNEYEPWVELFNGGGSAVDLNAESYYLTDSAGDLTKWAFPAGWVITNGNRLLVWADGETGETAPGYLHAGFVMNSQSGMVALVTKPGADAIIVDYVTYGPIGADYSYGLYPEGQDEERLVFHIPTPGTANTTISLVPTVRINEWMARNSRTIADPADGDFDDWFELYNSGSTAVALGGFHLTDDPVVTNKYTIPAGITVPAGGFRIVWADSETGQNGGEDLHASFALNGTAGDAILLYAPDGTLVDSVAFGPQVADVSEGCWPDGSSRIWPMSMPTPGSSNALFIITGVAKPVGDTAEIAWPCLSGAVYRVEYVDSMLSTNWTVAGVVTATTGQAVFEDVGSAATTQRFYRVMHVVGP